VLLPASRLHHGGNRRPRGRLQHADDARLLRARFGLLVAPLFRSAFVPPRARAACVRGCSYGGRLQPQPTLQLQSTGRSLGASSSGSSPGGSSVGATRPSPPIAPPAGGPHGRH
jgi:hypothetical protein